MIPLAVIGLADADEGVTWSSPDATIENRSAAPTASTWFPYTRAAGCGKATALSLFRGGISLDVPFVTASGSDGDCRLRADWKVGELPPGDYDLRVRIADGDTVERKTLQVHLPAAVLAADAVSLTRSWPSEAPLPVLVRETSGAASVPALAARWIGGATEEGQRSLGELICAAEATAGSGETPRQSAPPLPAHGFVTFACTPKGFEIGRVTGTLRLSGAPASPLDVEVTVVHRLPSILIPALIVAGLALSGLLRGYLQPRLELLGARRAAFEVLARIERRHRERPDTEEKDRLVAIARTLREVVDTATTAGAVTDATAVAEAEVKTAEQEAQDRLRAVRARIEAVAERVSPRWRLPAPMLAELDEMRRTLAGTRELLSAGRTAEADLLATRLERAFTAATERAPAVFRPILRALSRAPASVRRLEPAFRGAVAAADAPQPDPDAFYPALHAAFDPLDSALPSALRQGARDLAGAARTLEKLAPPADLAHIRGTLEGLAVPEDLTGALAVLLTALEPAAASVESAIEGRLDALAPDEADAVQKLLDTGGYVAAALRLQGGGASTGVGIAAQAEPALAPRPPPPAPADAFPLPAASWFSATTRALTTSEARLRSAYHIVVGVGIAVFGTSLFAGDWVGTPEDILSVLSWALGLDLSAAAVFAVAGQVRKVAIPTGAEAH